MIYYRPTDRDPLTSSPPCRPKIRFLMTQLGRTYPGTAIRNQKNHLASDFVRTEYLEYLPGFAKKLTRVRNSDEILAASF